MENLTIGIEEEYQIIDPESRELTSFVTEFLEQRAMIFRDQVKPEFLQSQIEVVSRVCKNIQEVRQEIQKLRRTVGEIAIENNRRIIAAAKPVALWPQIVNVILAVLVVIGSLFGVGHLIFGNYGRAGILIMMAIITAWYLQRRMSIAQID